MLGNRELGVDDYLAILRRRLWVIVIPALLGPILAYGISLALKERFTSQTLILVDQQKVPEAYVKSIVTDELTQRLATMQEQIFSRTRLQPIIEKFGLYKDKQGRVPMEEQVEELRNSIKLIPVATLVGGRGGGLPGFYITFISDNPRVAQQICGEITSMFMEENLKVREQRATSTTEFLQKQLDDAKNKLDEQDKRLAVFKTRFIGQLPGQEQTNMNILMGLNTQLTAVAQLLSRTHQDKTYMESLLAQQLAAWQASQAGSNPETMEQKLANLQSELGTLEARYKPDHPDVIRMKDDIAQLKKQIDQGKAAAREKPQETSERPNLNEPPQIQQLRNQIYLAERAIKEKTREQEQLQQQIKLYESRVQLSPTVEQQYKELTRDYEIAAKFYNEVLSKRTQSEMATDLERRQQGEQFKMMDPPSLPERPSFPNRPLFALGGLGGGLGLGLGIVLLLEVRDKSLRNEREVEFYLQLPTLATLPVVGEINGKPWGFGKPRKKTEGKAAPRAQA